MKEAADYRLWRFKPRGSRHYHRQLQSWAYQQQLGVDFWRTFWVRNHTRLRWPQLWQRQR